MPEQRIWRPLPLAPSHGLPVLLVAVSTGPASYTIRVTDMANLWVEDLDRIAICRRGWDEHTSIDPSDTPENMAKFLGSLRSALDTSLPGHDQTSLTLSPGASTQAGEGGLTIKVHCALPGIEPLRWPIHLKKAPPSAMATDLVLPLMEGHHNKNSEVDSLIQSLNTKDAVIAKLVDKLEAIGTGLENVFTGLSGKRKVTKAVAEEKIRGLAPFEENKWRASLNHHGDRPTDVNGLLRGLSETHGLRTQSTLEVDASPDLDKWWHTFHGAASKSTLVHPKASSSSGHREMSSESGNFGKSNGAFEDQPVSSSTHSGEQKTAPAAYPGHDDESTADEDDGVATTVTLSQRSRDSHTTHPARTGPFGKIGGRKAASTSQASASSASGSQQRRAPVVADDTETASDTDGSVQDDGDASAPPPPPFSAPLKSGGSGSGGSDAPRKGGLGRIGGISRRPQPPEEGRGDSPGKPPLHKKVGMIGKIGGATSTPPPAAAAAAAAPSADGVERGRAPIKRDDEIQVGKRESQIRETSTERAERRREELKREVEKKALAGPAKKKRRF